MIHDIKKQGGIIPPCLSIRFHQSIRPSRICGTVWLCPVWQTAIRNDLSYAKRQACWFLRRYKRRRPAESSAPTVRHCILLWPDLLFAYFFLPNRTEKSAKKTHFLPLSIQKVWKCAQKILSLLKSVFIKPKPLAKINMKNIRRKLFMIDNDCGLKNATDLRIMISFVGRNEKERAVPQGCPRNIF